MRMCAPVHRTSTLPFRGHSHKVHSTSLSTRLPASVLAFPLAAGVAVAVVVAAAAATTATPLAAATPSTEAAEDLDRQAAVDQVVRWLQAAMPFLTIRGVVG